MSAGICHRFLSFILIVFLIICQMVSSQGYAIHQCLLIKMEVNTRLI